MATFELVDGNILQEHVWDFDEEEEVELYLEASGYDSNFYQFTFGFPLYIFAYSFTLVTYFLLVQIIQYAVSGGRNNTFEGGDQEGSDKEKEETEKTLTIC